MIPANSPPSPPGDYNLSMSLSDKQRLEHLRRELNHHNHLYYVDARPVISDQEYDRLMRQLIEAIQGVTDAPLCIDSSVPAALEAGLAACDGRPLLNSVTGEEERLELVLPLVKKYNVPVVAISNDDTGISPDPDVRFAVAKKIVQRAADFGIPAHDIVVDPLVMPVGAMGSAGQQVFALVRRLREELGVNTTCGASNISFGLPHRHGVNAAFLPMAIGAGMTSAIMNPVRAQEMEAIRAANLLMNHDPNGTEWIKLAKVLEAMKDGASFAEASAAASWRVPCRAICMKARSSGTPIVC